MMVDYGWIMVVFIVVVFIVVVSIDDSRFFSQGTNGAFLGNIVANF
jgi:hypothetical protein